MTIDDVNRLQQKIADVGVGRRYQFELPWAPNFALEGRYPFAAGAVGRVVYG